MPLPEVWMEEIELEDVLNHQPTEAKASGAGLGL